MADGFRLGNHVFLSPGERAPLSRILQEQCQAITGARPPAFLSKVAREPQGGPADLLVDGKFCGHGEPTFAIFDIVIDGGQDLEISILDLEDGGFERFLVRRAGRREDWTVLYMRSWHIEMRIPQGAETVPAGIAEVSKHPDGYSRFRVSVGVEYPPDCASENEITWLALAVCALDGPFQVILFSQEFP